MCSNAEIQINPEEDKGRMHYCLINSRERSLGAIQNSTHRIDLRVIFGERFVIIWLIQLLKAITEDILILPDPA